MELKLGLAHFYPRSPTTMKIRYRNVRTKEIISRKVNLRPSDTATSIQLVSSLTGRPAVSAKHLLRLLCLLRPQLRFSVPLRTFAASPHLRISYFPYPSHH
jgi:hypothetical protein